MHVAAFWNKSGDGPEIGNPASHRCVGVEAADALIMITLGVERLSLGEPFFRQTRMLAHQRVAEQRPVPLILPARIRHYPIEVVEHARDQQVGGPLRRRQRGVDGQPVFFGEIRKNSLAVADRMLAVHDVGKLAARRL